MEIQGNKSGKVWLAFIISTLVILAVVECTMLLLGFIYADEIECNLLWCTFTKQIGTSEMECFVNGERADCSDVEREIGYLSNNTFSNDINSIFNNENG